MGSRPWTALAPVGYFRKYQALLVSPWAIVTLVTPVAFILLKRFAPSDRPIMEALRATEAAVGLSEDAVDECKVLQEAQKSFIVAEHKRVEEERRRFEAEAEAAILQEMSEATNATAGTAVSKPASQAVTAVDAAAGKSHALENALVRSRTMRRKRKSISTSGRSPGDSKSSHLSSGGDTSGSSRDRRRSVAVSALHASSSSDGEDSSRRHSAVSSSNSDTTLSTSALYHDLPEQLGVPNPDAVLMSRINFVKEILSMRQRRFSFPGTLMVTTLVVLTLTYPTLVQSSGLIFRCDEIDMGREGIQRLFSRDRTVNCASDVYHFNWILAITMLSIYGFCVPGGIVATVVGFRHAGGIVLARTWMAFLMNGFRSACWWWETTNMLRKFIVMLIVVFVPWGKLQTILFLWSCIASFLAHIVMQPYQSPRLHLVEAMGQSCMIVTLNVVLVFFFLNPEVRNDNPTWFALSVVVFVVNMLAIMTYLAYFVVAVATQKWKRAGRRRILVLNSRAAAERRARLGDAEGVTQGESAVEDAAEDDGHFVEFDDVVQRDADVEEAEDEDAKLARAMREASTRVLDPDDSNASPTKEGANVKNSGSVGRRLSSLFGLDTFRPRRRSSAVPFAAVISIEPGANASPDVARSFTQTVAASGSTAAGSSSGVLGTVVQAATDVVQRLVLFASVLTEPQRQRRLNVLHSGAVSERDAEAAAQHHHFDQHLASVLCSPHANDNDGDAIDTAAAADRVRPVLTDDLLVNPDPTDVPLAMEPSLESSTMSRRRSRRRSTLMLGAEQAAEVAARQAAISLPMFGSTTVLVDPVTGERYEFSGPPSVATSAAPNQQRLATSKRPAALEDFIVSLRLLHRVRRHKQRLLDQLNAPPAHPRGGAIEEQEAYVDDVLRRADSSGSSERLQLARSHLSFHAMHGQVLDASKLLEVSDGSASQLLGSHGSARRKSSAVSDARSPLHFHTPSKHRESTTTTEGSPLVVALGMDDDPLSAGGPRSPLALDGAASSLVRGVPSRSVMFVRDEDDDTSPVDARRGRQRRLASLRRDWHDDGDVAHPQNELEPSDAQNRFMPWTEDAPGVDLDGGDTGSPTAFSLKPNFGRKPAIGIPPPGSSKRTTGGFSRRSRHGPVVTIIGDGEGEAADHVGGASTGGIQSLMVTAAAGGDADQEGADDPDSIFARLTGRTAARPPPPPRAGGVWDDDGSATGVLLSQPVAPPPALSRRPEPAPTASSRVSFMEPGTPIVAGSPMLRHGVVVGASIEITPATAHIRSTMHPVTFQPPPSLVPSASGPRIDVDAAVGAAESTLPWMPTGNDAAHLMPLAASAFDDDEYVASAGRRATTGGDGPTSLGGSHDIYDVTDPYMLDMELQGKSERADDDDGGRRVGSNGSAAPHPFSFLSAPLDGDDLAVPTPTPGAAAVARRAPLLVRDAAARQPQAGGNRWKNVMSSAAGAGAAGPSSARRRPLTSITAQFGGEDDDAAGIVAGGHVSGKELLGDARRAGRSNDTAGGADGFGVWQADGVGGEVSPPPRPTAVPIDLTSAASGMDDWFRDLLGTKTTAVTRDTQRHDMADDDDGRGGIPAVAREPSAASLDYWITHHELDAIGTANISNTRVDFAGGDTRRPARRAGSVGDSPLTSLLPSPTLAPAQATSSMPLSRAPRHDAQSTADVLYRTFAMEEEDEDDAAATGLLALAPTAAFDDAADAVPATSPAMRKIAGGVSSMDTSNVVPVDNHKGQPKASDRQDRKQQHPTKQSPEKDRGGPSAPVATGANARRSRSTHGGVHPPKLDGTREDAPRRAASHGPSGRAAAAAGGRAVVPLTAAALQSLSHRATVHDDDDDDDVDAVQDVFMLSHDDVVAVLPSPRAAAGHATASAVLLPSAAGTSGTASAHQGARFANITNWVQQLPAFQATSNHPEDALHGAEGANSAVDDAREYDDAADVASNEDRHPASEPGSSSDRSRASSTGLDGPVVPQVASAKPAVRTQAEVSTADPQGSSTFDWTTSLKLTNMAELLDTFEPSPQAPKVTTRPSPPAGPLVRPAAAAFDALNFRSEAAQPQPPTVQQAPLTARRQPDAQLRATQGFNLTPTAGGRTVTPPRNAGLPVARTQLNVPHPTSRTLFSFAMNDEGGDGT